MDWKRFEPRNAASKHPLIALILFFCLLLLFAYGNLIAARGGVLDKAILNKKDVFYRMDRYAASKASEGFESAEMVPLILRFTGGIAKKDLVEIYHWNQKAKEIFGDRVLSLAETPNYKDTGEELLDAPYISLSALKDLNFDLKSWKQEIRKDAGVYGILIGRDFDWAAVAIYMRPGYNEMEEAWKIVELVENRKINQLERFIKNEICPENQNLGVAGWLMGRWSIHQGLNRDMFSLISLGLSIAFIVFALSVGSFSQALFAVCLVIVPAIFMTRGSVGLIEWLGWDIRERVYLLLGYANCIVQGISFSLHKFESFNQSHDWQKSKKVDWLISITALISTGGFATLYWFEVLTIRELGVLSALGIIYLLFLSTLILPALHSFFIKREEKFKQREFRFFNRIIGKLSDFCSWLTTRFSFKPTLGAMIGVLAVSISLFLVLLIQGKLFIRTNPLEFIKGTLVYQTAHFLNQPGRIGFDFLDLLVEPKDVEKDIHDPEFIKEVWSYQKRLKEEGRAREVSSVIGAIAKIAQESYGKSFPETSAELNSAFFLIESNLSPLIQRQLWYEKGIRVSASAKMEGSEGMGIFVERALELAQKYPQLKVSSFGKLAQYPRIDWYIRMGKPKNLFSSQWVVILFCAGMIWWKRKRMFGCQYQCHGRLSPFWGGQVMSIPLIFSSAMMGLVMIFWGIPLDIATAAITALAINASIDFSIYFVDAYQEALVNSEPIEAVRAAMVSKGRMIIKDMILNIVCFFPLCISQFQPVKNLGWIMGVMLVFCCIGSLVVMPPFLVLATRRQKEES
ncbi:MAG: MMPL family transporter [Patescibacteria group bacterium]|nr:MMPL family transporter [Patescibacteria group bacterium]